MVECPTCHKIYKKEGKHWLNHQAQGCDGTKASLPAKKYIRPSLTTVGTTVGTKRRSPRLAYDELLSNQQEMWNLFTRNDIILHELAPVFESL